MKIFLLNPPFKSGFGKFSRDQRSPAITKSGTLYYPVWLSYAAGVLEKAGHQVNLLDACAQQLQESTTYEYVKKFNPDIVVINTSTPSLFSDLNIAKNIKLLVPNTIIIVVGTHPSALPEETLTLELSIDIVARREYEYTLLELAEKIEKKESIAEIMGITFRDKETGTIRSNCDRPFIEDLDELPFASEVYNKFLNIRDYFFAAAEYPMVMIFTGRGCPNNCFFCVYPQTFHGRKKYRLRSPENVVAEFEYIVNQMPEVKTIGIEDDTFTADLVRTKKICRLLIEKGLNQKITWWVNARVTLDYETMKLMKKAGCRLLIAGFESGSREVLEGMHKGITVQQSIDYVKNAKKVGLLIHGCFMVGNPGETRISMQETLDLAIRLNVDTAQFFPLMVYPGTEAFEWAKKNKLLITTDYSQWVTEEGLHNCVICADGISSEELVAFCNDARRKYYLRPTYLLSKIIQVVTKPAERQRILKAGKRFLKFLFKGDK
jgi:anaerobic magnesium-protoporphyrin IX monomethyl ester cyclase